MATDYAPTPVENFLDPDDPAMFPRLTPEQVEYLAGIGAQRTFARGDEVFGHGQRETPLYIVQSGAVDIIDHAPGRPLLHSVPRADLHRRSLQEANRHPDFSRHWDGPNRGPLLLECTRPGVFVIGDARRGSTKRVAAAVGDGALVVRSIHASLASST